MSSNVKPKKGIFYGWFVLGACFFVMFVTTGARNGVGVFVIPMSDSFDWSRGTISIALALGWLVNGITQPFLGQAFDRYGGRKVIAVSLLVMGGGTVVLSQTNSIWFLILVYSIVISTATSGASMVTVHALLAKWFYRKRGIALSLSTSGASAGALVLAPFTAFLILEASWRITWGVLGGMILLLALPLALILIRDEPVDVGERPDGDADERDSSRNGGPRSTRRGPLEFDDWRDSYRTTPMWQLTGAYFVCGVTTAIISFHYVPFAVDRGFSLSTAALAFGLMSGLNVIGVLGIGVMSDRFGRKYLLGSVYAVRGLAYAMLLLAPDVMGLWGFALIAGLSWVATAPLTSALTADIYGLKNIGTLGGLASFAHQLGGALSILMAGLMYDWLGSYDVPFAIAGSMLVGASLASFAIRERRYSVRYQTGAEPVVAPAGGHD